MCPQHDAESHCERSISGATARHLRNCTSDMSAPARVSYEEHLPHHFGPVPHHLHVHIAGPVGVSHEIDLRKVSLDHKNTAHTVQDSTAHIHCRF